ncbi:2-octaprenyl-6-methoxyphenyl hydroxylase [Pseudidiomarina sediminum]|uniref:2-octaprenyl-6-methoxyphenyl hydroxylase n=1 Tax=Pseudidiomarina sediminum TaxID=431675 RepID=A0A432Z143_9GAMM|nr:2-octaprenyl-6-methoxyphenyl hydroxylase [Pseudidiomarina sediminum]RUO69877.1 2-octaprenyl-6-methoxyphenyl hydroxylase [Pseudidiomarina sediminum]
MDAKQVTHDVIIAGGGLVGSLAAVLLARQRPDLSIVVVEPQPQGPVPDKRTIALAAATVGLLQRQQLWQPLTEVSEAIQHIHVSDRGYLGATRLHAEQEGVAALGQVVPAAALNRVLYDAIAELANVTWFAGARVSQLEQHSDFVAVTLAGETELQQLAGRLVVAADGQQSFVREAVGIQMQTTDYGQVGIIANVQLERDMDGWAYERFTETGPLALLPLPNKQASLVWSVTEAQAEVMQQWSAATFVAELQQAFGYRAGRILSVGERFQYPLKLHLAERSVAHRVVVIGNASHTLHPIAGQGFNLGVRDAICLSQQLAHATDVGSYTTLADYWQQREGDYNSIIGLTDMLVRGFSNQHWPLTCARNLALLGLDALPPLRQAFARRTMGLAQMPSGVRAQEK